VIIFCLLINVFFIIADEINVFFAFIHHDLLTYRDFSLAYSTFGSGKEKFLAFHGFGQDGNDFQVFEQRKKHDWQIFTFHWFFHHPASKYPADRIIQNEISKRELADMIIQFLDQRNITKVNLMAHSMGGKMAMVLTEMIPHRIDKVILFAADGIEKKFWNGFAVKNKWGRKLFARMIDRPQFAINLGKALLRFRIINEKVYAITTTPLSSKENRLQIYNTWMSTRLLFPDQKLFKANIKKHHIELYGFYGSRDKIIRLKKATNWAKYFKPKKVIYPINAGHILLKNKYVREILEILD